MVSLVVVTERDLKLGGNTPQVWTNDVRVGCRSFLFQATVNSILIIHRTCPFSFILHLSISLNPDKRAKIMGEVLELQLDSPIKMSTATDSSSSTKNKRIVKIAVGSSNPCKLEAVSEALERVLLKEGQGSELELELDVQGFSVESGVSDQPFGDEETRDGAKNRAKEAYDAYKQKNGESAHLAIGLEGGLEWCSTVEDENDEDTLWCMAWIAVYGTRRKFLVDVMASEDSKFYTEKQKPFFNFAKTATFLLPSGIAKLVEDGMELGHADDKLFDRTNSKQGSGTVGILTNGLITRAEYYEHALMLALVPWIRPDVYGSVPASESEGFLSRLICSSRK